MVKITDHSNGSFIEVTNYKYLEISECSQNIVDIKSIVIKKSLIKNKICDQ